MTQNQECNGNDTPEKNDLIGWMRKNSRAMRSLTSTKWQPETSKFKVLTTTWADDSKS